jgi:hypothetical protein
MPSMPHTPETPVAKSLEYDRGAEGRASVRRYRLLLGLTLFNTVLLLGLVAGPYLLPFAREKWQQWQAARAQEQMRREIAAFEQKCAAHAPSPQTVVYEEDPAEAAKLLATPGGAYERVLNTLMDLPAYQPPVRAVVPDYVEGFGSLAAPGGGGGLFGGGRLWSAPCLLFMHERTTPGGQKLLVEVWLNPWYQIGSHGEQTDAGSVTVLGMTKRRRLIARAWSVPPAPAQPQQVHEWLTLLALPDADVPELARVPAAERARPSSADDGDAAATTQPVPINYGNRLRFYAGQPDPADPSHFTIAYQFDGKPGTIDGRVRDSRLVLRPREGAPAGDDVVHKLGGPGPIPEEVWDLTAPAPATRPAP